MSQFTALSAAARTATTTSATLYRQNASSLAVILNVTAVPTVETLTMKIQGLTASGVTYDILTGTASAATGKVVLSIGSGLTTTANVSAGLPLPDAFQIVVTHSASGSFTYSVECNTSL